MQTRLPFMVLAFNALMKQSIAVKALPDPTYVDVTIQVGIENDLLASRGNLPFLVRKVAQEVFETNQTGQGATVCFQVVYFQANGDMNINRKTTANELIDLIALVSGVVKRPTSLCSPSRRGAHKILVRMEKLGVRYGWSSFESEVEKAIPDPGGKLRQLNLTALVAMSDFTVRSGGKLDLCAMFAEDRIERHCRYYTTPNEFLEKEPNKLWKGLQNVLDGCSYATADGSVCYYDEKRLCALDEKISRKDPVLRYCGEDWIRRKPCDNTACDAECERRLDEAPCRSSGGGDPGVKILTIDGDNFTKFCNVQQKPCTVTTKTTNQTTSVPAKLSGRGVVGLALLGLGLAFFSVGGIGLATMAFTSTGFGRRRAPKKRQIVPAIKNVKKKTLTKASKSNKKK